MSVNTDDDRFVFVDIETTGLDHLTDLILEVGIVITDSDLQLIDMYDVQIWESPTYDRKWESVDAFVRNMHDKSGLYDQCRAEGLIPTDAENLLYEWLDGHGVRNVPLAGSSVHFDRSFLYEDMPKLHSVFGYRNIDVSSIKELCRRVNPDLLAKLDSHTTRKEHHRAVDDCQDTIGELRFYLDNFLWVA
jgi:oligoribonuclease